MNDGTNRYEFRTGIVARRGDTLNRRVAEDMHGPLPECERPVYNTPLARYPHLPHSPQIPRCGRRDVT